MLCFLMVSCLVCAMLNHWNMVVPSHWRLPISVVIAICGMAIGVVFLRAVDFAPADVLVAGMQGASFLDPHAILYVLLPPLLFESASSMSWHVLGKVLPSAVLLAVPGVVLNLVLVAVFARLALHVEGIGDMTWEASLLLGSILSATDPVAVVAALHSLGAPKKLATLIEGESLLNDGSAVVFFGVFLDMAASGAPDSSKQCPGIPPDGGCVCLYFMRLALGGPLLGGVLGVVLHMWIGWARERESPVLEVAMVLVAIYGGFFMAESMHVSGVLAVVTLGIFATASVFSVMSHEGRHALHVVLPQICYSCNHVIFFVAGMISARFMWSQSECIALYTSPRSWLDLLLLYVMLHVFRTLVLAMFAPMLTRLGYGITWKEGGVLVWGGLRGAVGLAMGLLVEHNPYVDERISATVAFHVSGIVLLTLVVNGMSVDFLYHRLQPYPPNPFSMTDLRKSLCILEEECSTAIFERMLDDWFFKDVDFESILACVPNFGRIAFGGGGTPYPAGLQTVRETLQSLEVGATRFRQELEQRQTETALRSVNTSPSRERRAAGEDEASLDFASALLEEADPGPCRDHLVSVVNTGDQSLEYRAWDRGSRPGLYVSSRPLSAVSGSDSAHHHGFGVKVVTMEGTHIVVGLVARWREDTTGGEPTAPTEAPDVQLRAAGGSVLGAAPDSLGFDVLTGMVRYRGPGGDAVLKSPESPVPPGETVQVIARREPDREWQIVVGLGEVHCRVLATCTLGPFPPDRLFPAIQFCHPQATPHRTRPINCTLGDLSHIGHVTRPTHRAVVSISYEPQTASDGETLRQLFHAIFNVVVHRYHELHDHGLIGSESLAWLVEAVEGAMDCAEGEVNRTRAEHFGRLRQLSRDASPRLRAQPVEESAASTRSYLRIFEPVIVEYLYIERSCSSRSVFDRLSRSWSIFRRRDYHQTLVKVETLWAFVEVHEAVLRKYTAMERFPDLPKCLAAVVKEAKRHIQLLADAKPRRYWYSKHYLALKVLMTKKRETLAKFANEGWIDRDNCEHLNKSLRDRIQAVDYFIPPLYFQKALGRSTRRNAAGGTVGPSAPPGQAPKLSVAWVTTPMSVLAPDQKLPKVPERIPDELPSPKSAVPSLSIDTSEAPNP